MKVENKKIVEITEAELFGMYLERNMDDIMDFREYRFRFEKTGCVVKDGFGITGTDASSLCGVKIGGIRTVTPMAELKPCPFCGGKVRVAKTSDGGQLWWFVTRATEAGKCTCRVFMESMCFYAETPHEEKQKLKQDLIEAWNRRVGDKDGS